MKAKSEKLQYVRARRGLFVAAISHFKTLLRAILYLDTFITFKFLLFSYRVFLFLPAFCHKNGPRLLHNHQYIFHGRRFHPSFPLFPLSKDPYFTQKISDFSRKISNVFGKTSHVFPKISNVFPKTLDFFSSQKEWAEDTQWNANSNGLARRQKNSPEKETFTWSSIRLSLHLQQHSHLKTFRQWILTK